MAMAISRTGATGTAPCRRQQQAEQQNELFDFFVLQNCSVLELRNKSMAKKQQKPNFFVENSGQFLINNLFVSYL